MTGYDTATKEAAKASVLNFLQEVDAFNLGLAAVAAGITRRTLMIWRREDATFNAAILAAQKDTVEAMKGVLRDIALDEDLPAAPRVRAAQILLESYEPELFHRAPIGDEGGQKVVNVNIVFAPKPDPRPISAAKEILEIPAEVNDDDKDV